MPQSAVAWHEAQLAYLRHIQKRRIKKRPTLVRHSEGQTVRRDGLSPVVAGGACFNKAVEAQTESVHINGILAAFRAKAWVLARGWDVSLGTVGTERLWRNLQRMARNKGRSRASLSTVNLVLLMRWCREVQSRLFAGGQLGKHRGAGYASVQTITQERVAACLLGQQEDLLGPLPSAAQDLGISEADVSQVYSVFSSGRFL